MPEKNLSVADFILLDAFVKAGDYFVIYEY